jgi:hypothetical protein
MDELELQIYHVYMCTNLTMYIIVIVNYMNIFYETSMFYFDAFISYDFCVFKFVCPIRLFNRYLVPTIHKQNSYHIY